MNNKGKAIAVIAIIIIASLSYLYTHKYLNTFEQEKKAADNIFEEEMLSFQLQLNRSEREIFDSIHREENAKVAVRKLFIPFLDIGSEYNSLAPDYLDCSRKVITAYQESRQNSEIIDRWKTRLSREYGSTYDTLYARLTGNNELVYKTGEFECNTYFPDLKLIRFEPGTWSNIETNLIKQAEIIQDVQSSNAEARAQLNNQIRNSIGQFRNNYQATFRNAVERESSSLLQTNTQRYVADTNGLSQTTLNLETTIFNRSRFKSILQQHLTEHWRENSLSTGSMPYLNCFSARNSCSGSNCSEIRVNNSGSDAVITVKNINGRVVRHAYVRGNDSLTIHLPDGTYQTFFYSGRGWNPNKSMSSSSCSQLRGGFVSNESFTKDPGRDNLRRNIITYTMTPTRSGNFNTRNSNASQNF